MKQPKPIPLDVEVHTPDGITLMEDLMTAQNMINSNQYRWFRVFE